MANPLDAAVIAATVPLERARRLANSVIVSTAGPPPVIFEGWESIRIQRAIDQIAGSFSLSFVDKWRQTFMNWALTPGKEIVVTIGNTPVMRGYIDKLDVSVTNEDRRLEITGRDRTGDLVDSSVPTFPSEYKLVTLTQLAGILVSPHLIPVVTDVPDVIPFQKVTVRQGESVFELLHRLADLRNLILQTTELGVLKITNRLSPTGNIPGIPLVQGANIVDAQASYDYTDRFFQYNIRGQAPGNDLTNRKLVTQITGFANDPVMALRPARQKTIVCDGTTAQYEAQQKANFEANMRAAKSVDVQIKVQGWRQDLAQIGPLWAVNQACIVDAPFIGVQKTVMLVRSVQFNKSVNDGTTTTLGLTRADAYLPASPTVNPAVDPSQNLGWLFSPSLNF